MSKNLTINLQHSVKRLIDIVIAMLSLALTSPLLLVLGILVKLDSPGPVLFSHCRIGKDGVPFKLYKFRTMVTGGDDTGYMNYLRELIESAKENPCGGMPYTKMKNDGRVTRIGRVLRTSYLDELPQMLNVLKGELSLVGPRPHVQFEVDCYTPEQRRRLSVKPGVTGLWQVTAKADCTFSELLTYDLEYIDNWSLLLDLQIIFSTVFIMLRGGEAFWTRTTKRIPRRPRAGIQRKRLSSDLNDVKTGQSGENKWFQLKLPELIRRRISFRNNR